MNFDTWFNKQSKIVQILLLLIPVVNWITEILVRLSAVSKNKGGVLGLAAFVLVLILGLAWGWIDMIWCLLFNRLTFTN